MKNLKIGLLVDSLDLDDFNSEVYSNIQKNNFCSIDTIIINRKISKKKKIFNVFNKYSIFRIIEKIIFKMIFLFEKFFLYNLFNKYNFSKINLEEIDCKKIYVNQIVSKKNIYFEYNSRDLEQIKYQNLDLIIRMGAGIIKGKILDIPRHGILSFHHGDSDIIRGGPPGFWEVYLKKPTTGFIIQRLNNNLDSGDVLFKGSFTTMLFYYQNQKFVHKQSAKYIENVLKRISTKKNLIIKNKIYYNRIFKDPNIIQIINYLFRTYSSIIYKMIRKIFFFKKDVWQIAFKKGKFNEHRLNQYHIIESKSGYLADPFLYKKNNINYLFVEEFDFKKKKGLISCFKIDSNRYYYIGKVLEENFHLSFPYIFSYDGEIYMCPETSAKKEIRLYRCVNFPLKWEFKKTIIENISAVDTLIFQKEGRWWLITNTDQNEIEHASELNIFYSDMGPLTNRWIAHKSNPIYVDPLKARNGGLICDNGILYRVIQKIGFNSYGKTFDINKISILNEELFEEKFFSSVKPNFLSNIDGTHHMNNNEDFTVFDFYKKKYFFIK